MRGLVTALLATLALGSTASSDTPPLSAVGDFDGDGAADRVEQQIDGERYRLVVTLARAPDAPIVVREGERNRAGDFLALAAAGAYQPFPFDGGQAVPIIIAHQAISTGTSEASEALIYWTGEGFRTVWIGD